VASLAATLRVQEGVISRRQAFACGLTRSALAHRTRPGGPWQRLLPGVYVTHTGDPAVVQKEMAALLYAGSGSALTGLAALRGLGLIAAEPATFDVLVPSERQRQSAGFVTIHRTVRMPARVVREGRRTFAVPSRALAEAARAMSDLRQVRALIAGAVQRRDCPLQALVQELDEGQTWHSARLRKVLEEVADGVRSVVEGELRDLILRAELPRPLFNPRLFTADGAFIACPDAWWPDAGVAVEVDSREWHLLPADWERTMRRHTAMISRGILVLHFSPARIRHDPAAVITAVRDALDAGRRHPPLPIITRSAA
jgi:hypothetical protein